ELTKTTVSAAPKGTQLTFDVARSKPVARATMLGRANMAGTADDTTVGLAAWIGAVLQGAVVCVHSLGDKQRVAGVDLRLLRASPRPGPRTADPVADLDYLATVQLADAAAEQQALVELLFAAMDRQDVEVLAGQDVVGICGSLGI